MLWRILALMWAVILIAWGIVLPVSVIISDAYIQKEWILVSDVLNHHTQTLTELPKSWIPSVHISVYPLLKE
jgi:hypothetical protein